VNVNGAGVYTLMRARLRTSDGGRRRITFFAGALGDSCTPVEEWSCTCNSPLGVGGATNHRGDGNGCSEVTFRFRKPYGEGGADHRTRPRRRNAAYERLHYCRDAGF
jgi:hypothetical protein